MRRFLVIAVPILTLSLFIVLMLSGNQLKKPMGEADNIPELVQCLINNINNENWEEAQNNAEKLSIAWSRIVRRVQFSAERDEINGFSMSIAKLRGAIIAKSKANSLSALFEAYEHWNELGN